MKREISPGLMAVIIGVIAVIVVVIGIKVLGNPGFKAQTTGGEKEMDKWKTTGEFYKPPAGIVPGAPTGGGGGPAGGIPTGPPGGGTTGGYNLTPPGR